MSQRRSRLVRRWRWEFDPLAYESARYPDPGLGNPFVAQSAPMWPEQPYAPTGQRWFAPDAEQGAPAFYGIPPVEEPKPDFGWDAQADRSTAARWYQPELEYGWTPPSACVDAFQGDAFQIDGFALCEPTSAQTAPVRQDNLDDRLRENRSRTWFAPDAELATQAPVAPPFDPAPYDWSEQPAFWRPAWWFQPDTEVWTPIPSLSVASVEAQAALWPEQPAVWLAPRWYQPEPGYDDDPAKPTERAVITNVWWGGGNFDVYHLTWDWPPGLGPLDVAITYYREQGLGWTQGNETAPDDYRAPSPGTDAVFDQGHEYIDVMVRVVRRSQDAFTAIFGVDPVMAIGDPVPAEAVGYASAVVRIFALRPAVWAGVDTSGQQDRSLAQSWLAPEIAVEPLQPPAAAFDPALVVPTFDADILRIAAAWGVSFDELAQVPIPGLTVATIEEQAAAWPDGSGQQDRSIQPTWTDLLGWAAEGLLPPFDPTAITPVLAEQPGQEASLELRWFRPDDDTLGIPPFGITIASVAEQAALWPEQPGQDRSLQPVWFVPDDAFEGLTPPAPPFVPADAFAGLPFEPTVVWRRDFTPDAIQEQFAGPVADWLFLVWGPPATTPGTGVPAVLIDATTGDPFVHLDGPFIARAD